MLEFIQNKMLGGPRVAVGVKSSRRAPLTAEQEGLVGKAAALNLMETPVRALGAGDLDPAAAVARFKRLTYPAQLKLLERVGAAPEDRLAILYHTSP